MPRYNVTKVLRLAYEVTADNEEAALAVPWPREDPDAVSILRERAKDLDKPKSVGPRVISDRVMRAGRTFTRSYAGHAHVAVVIPGGRVKLDGGEVFKNLHAATQAIRPGVSLNAWAWWKEVEPAAKRKAEPKAAKTSTKAEEPES